MMIKKQLLFLFITGIVAGNGFAKQRTMVEALNEAQVFVQSQPDLRSSASETLNRAETGLNTPYYYVFNRSNNTGFVIIAGDDRAKTVLGYSERGNFDVENLPSNMRYWLSEYEKELQALTEGKITETTEATPIFRANDSFAASIAPLIQTQWDQSAPYNNRCPVISGTGEKTLTGCTATALAQVMKFWQHPLRYDFSVNYTTDSLQIPINETFSGTYDWANMTDTYNTLSTPAENNAVATLMYHCGVAVNMDYNGNAAGSSASTYSPAAALTQKFGYDSNLQYYTRNFYTDTEWIHLLKTDLNVSRPVLYSGQSGHNGGHQFICDGYDANNYFHFNWGWSGTYDGYFASSALNPGWLNGDGYDYGQVIVTGIQPPNGQTTPPPYQMITDTALSVDKAQTGRRGTFIITAKNVRNLGAKTLTPYLGFGLYDSGQQLVDTFYEQAAPLPTSWGYGSFSFINMSISIALPAGNYRFYPVYSTDKINWQIIRTAIPHAPYLPVTLTSASIIFTPYSGIEVAAIENKTISIYPNPVKDILFVHSQIPLESIVLVDIAGKTIWKKSVQATDDISIPVNRLPAGLYILQGKTKTGITSVKFIKK